MIPPRPDPAPLSETELWARVTLALAALTPNTEQGGRTVSHLLTALLDWRDATVRALQQQLRHQTNVSRLLSDIPHYVVRDGVLEPVGAWPNRVDVLYRGSDLYAGLTAALQEPHAD